MPKPAGSGRINLGVLIVLFAGAVLVAALWWMVSDPAGARSADERAQPDDPEEQVRVRPPPEQSVEPDAARIGVGLVPGDVIRYVLEYDVKGKAALRGTLLVRVYAWLENRWTIGLQLEIDAPLMFGGGEVTLSVALDGRLDNPVFTDDIPIQNRRFWRDLLRVWVIHMPEGAPDAEWEADESDSLGRYEARYTRDSEEGASRVELTRHKSGYWKLFPGREFDGRVDATGKARFVLDPYLVLGEGRERRFFVDRASGVETEQNIRFSCKFLSRDWVDPRKLIVEKKKRTPRIIQMVFEDPLKGADEHQIRRAVQEILGKLSAAIAAADTEPGLFLLDSPYAQALMEHLRRFDLATATVMERLRDPACVDREAAVLIQVLGGSGSPAAAKGLLALLKDATRATELRRAALVALGCGLAQPDEMETTLVALHDAGGELAPDALFVLAGIGRRARRRDREKYSRIEAHIVGAFEGASDATHLLRALGRLAPERIPEPLRKCVAAKDEQLRAEAVRALAQVRTAEATALLGSMLKQDSSEDVRLSALAALVERGRRGLVAPDELRTLLTGASSDGSEPVRQAAARQLEQLRWPLGGR